MDSMRTTFYKRNCLQYLYAMILAKNVLLTVESLSLDLFHRLSQAWGGAMCYWDIIQRSCQDHPRVTQGQNDKNNIIIQFFAFLSFISPAYIYTYYGLDPFQMYNNFFRADY